MQLDKANLRTYLESKELIDKDESIYISEMEGGWINPLFLVRREQNSFVMKQILEKGKEGGDHENFEFPRERIMNEYHATIIAKKYGPSLIPEIIHADFENYILAIEYFESEMLFEWLKRNPLTEDIGRKLVNFLINLHNNTTNDYFVQKMVSHKSYWHLKYKYQYLEAPCSPKTKKIIKDFVEEFSKRKICLVHGDMNSRNVLVDKDNALKIIDFEEAAFNDPAHDIGMMLSQLIIEKEVFEKIRAKDILLFFNTYLKHIKFRNKEKLRRSIIMHTSAIILARLEGTVKYKFIPEDTKPKLRFIAENAILKGKRDINSLLM